MQKQNTSPLAHFSLISPPQEAATFKDKCKCHLSMLKVWIGTDMHKRWALCSGSVSACPLLLLLLVHPPISLSMNSSSQRLEDMDFYLFIFYVFFFFLERERALFTNGKYISERADRNLFGSCLQNDEGKRRHSIETDFEIVPLSLYI